MDKGKTKLSSASRAHIQLAKMSCYFNKSLNHEALILVAQTLNNLKLDTTSVNLKAKRTPEL